jgi:RNA polymerase sigma-70 factor (ECF subfamily)
MTHPDAAVTSDLERFRSYLRLQAEIQLSPSLRIKEDVSDIVQTTLLEAHRDLKTYRGTSEAELWAWLKTILTRNVLNLAKHYGTQKCDLRRERSLHEELEQSSCRLEHFLAGDQSTPSQQLVRQERAELLAAALAQLLDDERTAVVLKHFHDWRIDEIAQQLGRTSDAVAGLLRRGLRKLRTSLSEAS